MKVDDEKNYTISGRLRCAELNLAAKPQYLNWTEAQKDGADPLGDIVEIAKKCKVGRENWTPDQRARAEEHDRMAKAICGAVERGGVLSGDYSDLEKRIMVPLGVTQDEYYYRVNTFAKALDDRDTRIVSDKGYVRSKLQVATIVVILGIILWIVSVLAVSV